MNKYKDMLKIIICSLFFLVYFTQSAYTQVELYLHQPNCTSKTTVRIANNPQYKPKTINEETQLFVVDSPVEPKELVFIIDTVGLLIEKIWIEPSSTRIDFYLYNCRQYMFYVENPNELTREARANEYYVKYLYEKSKNDTEFKKVYDEYKIDYIKKNPDSFLSLNAFNKINISNYEKKKLLKLIGNKNKKYPFYDKLFKKINTDINLDSLNLDLNICNINKDTLHFKSFENKSVVFTFWMSGCKWSTKLLPDIISLNNKNKDIAFVYYCLDGNLEQWTKSSEKFNIPKQYNISELDEFLGDLPILFGVDRSPFFVAVDENQKITLVTFGDELYLIEKEIENFRLGTKNE